MLHYSVYLSFYFRVLSYYEYQLTNHRCDQKYKNLCEIPPVAHLFYFQPHPTVASILIVPTFSLPLMLTIWVDKMMHRLGHDQQRRPCVNRKYQHHAIVEEELHDAMNN